MSRTPLTRLGLGIGWRPELALSIDRRNDLGFVELTAENIGGQDSGWGPGELPVPIQLLLERGVQAVVHGVSLSLGGADRPDRNRLRRLDNLARRVNAPFVSEHIAFVRGGEIETGHLIPVPRTYDSLEILVANVSEAQDHLSRPLVLENIAALFDWPDADMSEAEFLNELISRTGVGLLLDIENVYANARNLNYDATAFLDQLALHQIAYVHIAGGVERDGLYHDSHAHDIPDAVLQLLQQLCARVDVPGVMLERDDRFPDDLQFNAELDRIKAAIAAGDSRRLATGDSHHNSTSIGSLLLPESRELR